MSNILIIKHGSLGDLVQANGAMKDIKQSFPNDKVFLLTTPPYANFMSYCPYINGVLIDKRLSRWNIFYLLKLKKTIESLSPHFATKYNKLSKESFLCSPSLIFITSCFV